MRSPVPSFPCLAGADGSLAPWALPLAPHPTVTSDARRDWEQAWDTGLREPLTAPHSDSATSCRTCVLPIDAAADRLRRLPVGQVLRELQQRHQHQPPRRRRRLAADGEEGREELIPVDDAEFVADPDGHAALGEGGAGGLLWDLLRGGYSYRPPRSPPDFGGPTFPFPQPRSGHSDPGERWREPSSRGTWSWDDDSRSRGGGWSGGGGSDDSFTTDETI